MSKNASKDLIAETLYIGLEDLKQEFDPKKKKKKRKNEKKSHAPFTESLSPEPDQIFFFSLPYW